MNVVNYGRYMAFASINGKVGCASIILTLHQACWANFDVTMT